MAKKTYEIAFELGAKKTGSFESAFSSAGKSIKALGPVAAAAGAAIVAGIGTAVTAVAGLANEMDKAFGKMKAQTGATSAEMAEMSAAVKDVYKNGFGESMGQLANDMAVLKQNLGTVDDKTLESAQILGQISENADIDSVARALRSMTASFPGATQQKSMDLITRTLQVGGDASGDLLDTFNEYSGIVSTLGIDMETFSNILVSGAKAGARNYDVVADTLKEFNIRAKDGSKTTAEGFAAIGLNADAMGAAIAAGGEKGEAAYRKTLEALGKIEDPVKRNEAGVALFGTKFEDLEWQAVKAMGAAQDHLGDFEGAVQRAGDALSNNFGFRMNAVWNKLKLGMTEAFAAAGGGKVLDLIATAAEKLVPIILNLTNKAVAFSQKIMQHWPAIQTKAIEIFNNIKTFVQPALEAVTSFVGEQVAKIRKFWQTDGAQILKAVQNAFNGIKAVIEFVMPVVLAIIKMVWDNIKGVINGALNIIMGAIKVFSGLFTGDWSKMWEGIKQVLKGAVEFAWNWINLMFIGRIIKGIGTFVKTLGSTLKTGWDNVITGIKTFVTNAKTWFDDLVTGVKTKFDDIVTAAKGLPKKIGDGIKEKFSDATGAIKELASNLMSSFKSALGIASPSKEFFNLAGEIVNGITKRLNKDNLVALGKKAFGGLLEGAGNAMDAMKGFFTGMFSGGGGGPAGPVGAGASGWRSIILAAAARMGETLTEREINGILAQIHRESGGNQSIVQSRAVWDINWANNNPARGLLQYIPQTFARYAVPGHGNIYSGYDQLLAFFNNTSWRRDLPYGTRGWGPRGPRKFAEGGVVSSAELAWVGEGKDTESIIPWNNSARSLALWALTGRKIGALRRAESPLAVKRPLSSSGASAITLENKPTIIIQASDVSANEVERQLLRANQSLLRQLEELKRDAERLSFG